MGRGAGARGRGRGAPTQVSVQVHTGVSPPVGTLPALLAALALLTLLALPTAAAPLAASDDVWVGWAAAFASGGKAAAIGHRTFLASTHEFALLVGNEHGAPIRNVTLTVDAPRQPFTLALEGPDAADSRPNATKPYAFWPQLPRAVDDPAQPGCACGFVILHSKHSDDFGGGFEFVARVVYEAPDGTNRFATSTLSGTIEGGRFELQPWQVWLIGATLVAVIAGGVWASRRRG